MGTSARSACDLPYVQDHPHACGDKYFCQVRHRHVVGSSPRVWGQVSASSSFNKYKGIIPTRVGTSGIVDMSHITHQDHPHACGDKTDDKTSTRTDNGSSPRVWGQVSERRQGKNSPRIIPTRVGTRNFKKFKICHSWDHPHACGDKRFTIFSVNSETGSSPRVWGQVLFFFVLLFTCGIIPTRVGTSYYQCHYPDRRKDHPHACGDKLLFLSLALLLLGSSPRVWGQDTVFPDSVSSQRIIPTRVGTSECANLDYCSFKDHPHACGDKVTSMISSL